MWLQKEFEWGFAAGPTRTVRDRRVSGLRGAKGLGGGLRSSPLRACQGKDLRAVRRRRTDISRALGLSGGIRAARGALDVQTPTEGWQDLGFLQHIQDLLQGGQVRSSEKKWSNWQGPTWSENIHQAGTSQPNFAKSLIGKLKECVNRNDSDDKVAALVKETVSGWKKSSPPADNLFVLVVPLTTKLLLAPVRGATKVRVEKLVTGLGKSGKTGGRERGRNPLNPMLRRLFKTCRRPGLSKLSPLSGLVLPKSSLLKSYPKTSAPLSPS